MNINDMNFNNDRFSLKFLEWDTEFFGVNSAKLVLKNEILNKDIESIENRISLNGYEFVTVVNENNNAHNNKLIYKLGDVFLADVNVQFEKCMNAMESECDENLGGNEDEGKVVVSNNVSFNEDILDISQDEFKYSRFFVDRNLINSNNVYLEWTRNSFGREDKFFACYEEENRVDGFVIFSFEDKESSLRIELIAVRSEVQGNGIGSVLLRSIEEYASRNLVHSIRVGTQLDNIRAQNFYIKNGFKHIYNNSIYHLWR